MKVGEIYNDERDDELFVIRGILKSKDGNDIIEMSCVSCELFKLTLYRFNIKLANNVFRLKNYANKGNT